MAKYYSTQRPVMIGSFPKPSGNAVVGIHNFESRTYVKELGRVAWGWIEYENPLTEKECEAYELVAAVRLDDKNEICRLLCKVLQLTSGASDLVSLDYDDDTELVTAVFEGGQRKINVAMDSGTAMIRDIVNHLEC